MASWAELETSSWDPMGVTFYRLVHKEQLLCLCEMVQDPKGGIIFQKCSVLPSLCPCYTGKVFTHLTELSDANTEHTGKSELQE